jgi:hypothetical protein
MARLAALQKLKTSSRQDDSLFEMLPVDVRGVIDEFAGDDAGYLYKTQEIVRRYMTCRADEVDDPSTVESSGRGRRWEMRCLPPGESPLSHLTKGGGSMVWDVGMTVRIRYG